MENWYKYSLVCNGDCDALIEYTFKAGYTPNEPQNIQCLCGSTTTLMSVVDATIKPTQQKEEQNMETAIDTYNPNLLVTYKVIENGEATYPTKKVVDLEWEIQHNKTRIVDLEKILTRYSNQLSSIISMLDEDNYYSDSFDKDAILNDLCETLDHAPVKDIEFTATMHFTGRMQVPLNEDFDLSEILGDAYVDINNGDVMIDNYELYDAEEC